MKEALYYKKVKDKVVQCILCPRFCVIKKGMRGNCGVRKNTKGKLYSLVYGKPCAVHVDPILKKPLSHFLPDSLSYSIGTAGCNLSCLYCQNYSISQAKPEDIPSLDMPPKAIVEDAIANDCESIAYTYTEPTIFIEYVLDTAKLAREKGLKNVIVSNGFINEEPLKELCKVIDGANIDLKGNDKFYREMSNAKIEPVLNSLKVLKEEKVWLEITNLIIPGYNDKEKDIKERCEWIKDNLGVEVPLHFSRFFPYYKLQNIEPTPQETLKKAKEIAKKIGLKYVYIGNIFIDGAENTICSKCGKLLVERVGFDILQNNIKKRVCECGEKINGVW